MQNSKTGAGMNNHQRTSSAPVPRQQQHPGTSSGIQQHPQDFVQPFQQGHLGPPVLLLTVLT